MPLTAAAKVLQPLAAAIAFDPPHVVQATTLAHAPCEDARTSRSGPARSDDALSLDGQPRAPWSAVLDAARLHPPAAAPSPAHIAQLSAAKRLVRSSARASLHAPARVHHACGRLSAVAERGAADAPRNLATQLASFSLFDPNGLWIFPDALERLATDFWLWISRRQSLGRCRQRALARRSHCCQHFCGAITGVWLQALDLRFRS
jgi:hypothetical protein